jgi:signal transduction histidine kinase
VTELATAEPAGKGAVVEKRGVVRASWIVATLAVATGVALVETRWREMQSALLLYFLTSFWLTLPRRLPWLLTFLVFAAVPFVAHVFTGTPASWSPLATLAALLLGTAAGAVAGRAFDVLDLPHDPADAASGIRGGAVRARVLLALALTAFAALGLGPVWASFRWGTQAFGFLPVPRVGVALLTVRWAQALTLVAWVLLTPPLLRLRARLRDPSHRGEQGVTTGDLARQIVVVVVLIAMHSLALATLGTAIAPRAPIFVGDSPSFPTLWLATAAAYAPFDALTYIAILGLAHLSDRARQAREARRRAATLQATAVAARLAALKARLDPHFLYNALNAAVTLARRGRGDETSHVLEELTALLRYVLDDTRPWTPLHEELAFVRRYLEIVQLRFGARFTYMIDVDPSAGDASIPSLILQPLVENAVEHGVANAGGPVSVRVAARGAGTRLIVTVEDDGPGPDASPRPGSGIGLGHTRERLAILYGDGATLTLAPRVPRGAVTELVLPLSSEGQ